MTLTGPTLRRAMDLGAQAYLDGEGSHKSPFSRRRYTGTRLDIMDELDAAWAEGFADAEREARAEMRHIRSERAAYFQGVI